jgi:hypothetical protein
MNVLDKVYIDSDLNFDIDLARSEGVGGLPD